MQSICSVYEWMERCHSEIGVFALKHVFFLSLQRFLINTNYNIDTQKLTIYIYIYIAFPPLCIRIIKLNKYYIYQLQQSLVKTLLYSVHVCWHFTIAECSAKCVQTHYYCTCTGRTSIILKDVVFRPLWDQWHCLWFYNSWLFSI